MPTLTATPASDLGSAIRNAVDAAAAQRFLAIRSRLHERSGEYRYDRLVGIHLKIGSMLRVELSLRFGLPGGLMWTPPECLASAVLAGDMDRIIEDVWHEAARGACLDWENRRELE